MHIAGSRGQLCSRTTATNLQVSHFEGFSAAKLLRMFDNAPARQLPLPPLPRLAARTLLSRSATATTAGSLVIARILRKLTNSFTGTAGQVAA